MIPTYEQTAAITVADHREKEQVEVVPEAWLDAWGEVQWVRYKLTSAVLRKGAAARWHAGAIAQQIVDAFAAHDLDATQIGIVCHEDWDEQRETVFDTVLRPTVLDDEGLVLREACSEMVDTGETRVLIEGGDQWGVRLEECFAMEAAWQRRELARLAARLAVLETRP
jgi:hypothetical protein